MDCSSQANTHNKQEHSNARSSKLRDVKLNNVCKTYLGNLGNEDRDKVSWEQADLIQSASEAGGGENISHPPSLNPTNMAHLILHWDGDVRNAHMMPT